MVNSGLFSSEGVNCSNTLTTTTNSQPINLPTDISAIEPIPTKTVENSINCSVDDDDKEKKSNIKDDNDEKTSLFCSVPLDKVQSILSTFKQDNVDNNGVKTTTKTTTNRKVLCLYCDRTFVNVMLKEKHIERCHSTKQFRRVSSRRHSTNNFTCTPCIYCDRLTTTTEHTLKELFQHLILNHSNRYFGCLNCEERFLNATHLADHNASIHKIAHSKDVINCSSNNNNNNKTTIIGSNLTNNIDEIPYKITRSRMKANNSITKTTTTTTNDCSKFRMNFDELTTTTTTTKKRNNLQQQNKKLIVKTRRNNKRLQQTTKINDKKKKLTNDKKDQQQNQQINEKNSKLLTTTTTTVNPYPEFDSFFRVKKITDHSIDNLKISSLTFDNVVFDKAFFNRIRFNIQENLLHYIDGKLFKNEESENRISNFEKNSSNNIDIQQTTTRILQQNIENYGCDITLNAATPTILTTTTTTTIIDDLESQIEYGAKATNKKNTITATSLDSTITTTTTAATTTTTTTIAQTKNNEINYKYFTRRKYQASILEQKENRDLSKLDMWTQYIIKKRQQKIVQSQRTQKEISDYLSCDEYKNQQKRDELNRILDRRGPFEDLREETSKKAALDKLNNDNNNENPIDEECFLDVRKLIDNLLDRVNELITTTTTTTTVEPLFVNNCDRIEIDEIAERPQLPSYLNLRRTSSISSDIEIDKSDKIALICSSQETENFELPTNQKRDKNEKIELTGEWARSRIYVCAACGLKLQNIKQLLEHKSLYHQYVWVQHYEFVGNQSELYRHLSIPSLGKVGYLENNDDNNHDNDVQCKLWKKSDARICTKCNKQCNSLGDLHRHILECGGDWTWMLARKKCRYRPFGTKSRRKRRGLVKRAYPQKSPENTEKKTYKKPFEGPRQKPSDAESIQRMLANLPPKRASRKLISLKDGFNHNRSRQQATSETKGQQQIEQQSQQQQQQVKCGKVIRRRLNNENRNSQNSQKNCNKNNVNKVISSRILDTNKQLLVKRKYNKNLNTDRITRQNKQQINVNNKIDEIKNANEIKTKRTSPRTDNSNSSSSNDNKKVTTFVEKMNIKRFFTVKKNSNCQQKDDNQKNNKRKLDENDDKKKDSFCNLVKTLSLRKKNTKKSNDETINEKQQEPKRKLRSSLKDMMKKICDLKDIQEKNNFLEDEFQQQPLPQQEQQPLPQQEQQQQQQQEQQQQQQQEQQQQQQEEEEEEEIPSSLQDRNQPTNSEKIVIPEVVVTQEIDTHLDDLPIMPAPIVVNYCVTNKQTTPLIGTIFNLHTNNEKILQAKCEEEQFNDDNKTTQTTTTTALLKLKQPTLISPKSKIKKPTRGLNDCIAMLTNKLNQNLNDSNNIDSIFNLMPDNNNNENNNDEIRKSSNRTLLKVPSYPKLDIKTDNSIIKSDIDEETTKNQKIELKIDENHLKQPSLICEDETIPMENKNLNVDLLQKNESDDELPLALLCEKKELRKITTDLIDETVSNENRKEINDNHVNHLDLITPETSQESEIKINQKIMIENENNDMDDSGFNSFVNRQNDIKTNNVNEEKENAELLNDTKIDVTIKENNNKKRGRKKKREKNFLFNFNDDLIINDQNSEDCKKWQEHVVVVDDDEIDDTIKLNHDKSLNLPNNTKELSLDSIGEENSEIDLQFNDIANNNNNNNDFIDDTTQTSTSRRRSVRSAKTKALEMIIGDALSELTDSERNIKNDDYLIDYNNHFNDHNYNGKKRKRKRSIDKKNLPTINKDIVDDDEHNKTIIEENDKENKKNEKKLSSDELFDLLKATSCENLVLTKSTSFLNNDEISNDFNDDHCNNNNNNNNTFENILEKTIDIIEENGSEKTPPTISMDVFDDNSSDDHDNDETIKSSIDKEDKIVNTTAVVKSLKRKRKRRTNRIKSKLLGEEIENHLENDNISIKENNNDNNNKIIDKSLYCDICDRSFCRSENLIKHKRTLTHISKLSEIEAREAAEKAKLKQQQQLDEEIDEINQNSLDISNEPPLLSSENPNLADIISDVLNKPDLNQNNDNDDDDNTIIENDEFKPRYRSLGERKSFDSENSTNNLKNLDYFEPELTKNAGTILEKQISLLENIIENRTNLNYVINDISLSNDDSKQDSNIFVQEQQTNDDNFLKPPPQQFEEISGDDHQQQEQPQQQQQQKLRKALNRDEELFLECCSLLKGGSEVTNYSKKSTTTTTKILNDLELKTTQEPDWLENKSLNGNFSNINEYSDNTRIPTPFGVDFINDNSNSNTNWHLNNKETCNKEEESCSFIFEEISDDDNNDVGDKQQKDGIDDVTKFSEIISKAVRKEYQNLNKSNDKDSPETPSSIENDKSDKIDDRKMLTKGAMKVFEGVKVSIPTQDLNMDEVLLNQDNNNEGNRKSKKLFKIKKPKNLLKNFKKKTNKFKDHTKKSQHDIYDFEETQDHSDLLFTKPDFRRFRNEQFKKIEPLTTTTIINNEDSDCDESQSDKNNIFESFSSSTSSISDLPNTIKPKSENLTKKKCMIMGRIFRNAAKSRSDDIIRDIPIIENSRFVEEFVLNCPEPTDNEPELQKSSITDKEINLEFDKLINTDLDDQKIDEIKRPQQQQQKKKVKTRKRNRANSDSTDDEFSLNNSIKKRNSRKSNKKEDNCINLEQELKECIGVASRKSQRKCTSGKQNVLVEYWSSDESIFETLKNETITTTTTTIQQKSEKIDNIEENIVKKHKELQINLPELNRRKRTAINPLYHWSSSSDDEINDLIEVKPIRDDEIDDDYDEDERPVQHGWIVGDSPKKLVTMLAQAKGKKCDADCVKEQKRKRTFS